MPEPRITYSPAQNFHLFAGGEFVGDSYRTDRDQSIFPAKLNGTRVDYTEFRAGAGFAYSPSKNVTLDVIGGYAIILVTFKNDELDAKDGNLATR